MDANGNPDAEPVVYTDSLDNRIGNIVLHPGDGIYYSRHDNGAHEYGLVDRDGHRFATLVGHTHPDRPGDFVIDAIQWLGGRGRLLPVRPQPESLTNPITVKSDLYTTIGDPPRDPRGLYHFHAHAHTKPDDALAIDYAHAHDHTHPAGTPDPGPYGDHDGRADLHDPGPGHGHDERGDDSKPGYPGHSGAVGPSDPPWR